MIHLDVAKIQALLNKSNAKPAKKPKPKGARTRQEICMNLAEDRIAAQLLATIIGIFESRKRKGSAFLARFGKEWIAMPRDEWAELANLGPGQMKNRALPVLKSRCASFLDIEQMRLNPTAPKEIWIAIDLIHMQEALTPWDVYDAFKKGGSVAANKVKYPYKTTHNDAQG